MRGGLVFVGVEEDEVDVVLTGCLGTFASCVGCTNFSLIVNQLNVIVPFALNETSASSCALPIIILKSKSFTIN